MAQNTTNGIVYYLACSLSEKESLGNIRAWSNLKVAYEGDLIWIKDLDYVQINSIEVKSLPSKTLYYAKEGKLYLLNSLLPHCNIPSLLWTPIERALPISIPDFNHNFFGLQERIALRLVPSTIEAKSIAMLTTLQTLEQYITSASAIRLQGLKWTIINANSAFITGQPLLPIDGNVFWQRGNFIIPAGYDFDLSILCDILDNSINPNAKHWVMWQTDNSYTLIPKNTMMPLSLSGFRMSLHHLAAP